MEEKAALLREEKENQERIEVEQEAFFKECDSKHEERERQKREEKEHCKQAALARKHRKKWTGEKFQDLEALVCKFVEQHVTLEKKSFMSCQGIKKAFIEQHVMQNLDEKFFFKTFKSELTKKHDTTKWKSHLYKGDRGYKGISIV